jgi:hypothetical protein
MKKFNITFFLFLFINGIYAQKENNQWIISWYELNHSHSLVDFNNSFPDTTTVISTIRFFLTNASICDTNGQLLFYSNGNVIYNRNHDSLFNTSGLNPGWLTNYYYP